MSGNAPRARDRPPTWADWALTSLLATLLCGALACRRQTPPAAVPSPAPAVDESTASDLPRDPAGSEAATEAPVVKRETVQEVEEEERGRSSRAPSQSSRAAVTKPLAAEETRPGVRLLLLSSVAPLLVQLDITVAGLPLDDAVQQLTASLLQRGATNTTAAVSWESWLASPGFPRFAVGVPAVVDPQQMRAQRNRWDRDADGEVDNDEVVYLLAGQPRAAGTFALAAGVAQEQVWDSPLRRWLDVDEDGRLLPDEIERAVDRLRSRDADADDVLHAADLTLGDDGRGLAGMQSVGPASAPAGLLLHQRRYWSRHLLDLQRYYSTAAGLGPASFPQRPDLFADLDANGDGTWNADELASLFGRVPDLRLQLAYDAGATDHPRLTFVETPTCWQHLVTAPTKVVLAWGEMRLECQIEDRLPSGGVEAVATQRLGSWDQDRNGYVDGQEYQRMAGTILPAFNLVDRDANEQLDLAELGRLVQQEREQRGVVVRAEVEVAADPLFNALDVNFDGRLTTRELLGASRRLRTLDADGDSVVTLAEVPTSLSLRIIRGGQSLPGVPAERVVATPGYDAAPWFRAMDANADADLSPREFLGTVDQFAEFDRDGDGLIDLAEAERWETDAER